MKNLLIGAILSTAFLSNSNANPLGDTPFTPDVYLCQYEHVITKIGGSQRTKVEFNGVSYFPNRCKSIPENVYRSDGELLFKSHFNETGVDEPDDISCTHVELPPEGIY